VRIKVAVIVLGSLISNFLVISNNSLAAVPFEIPRLEAFLPSATSVDLARQERKIDFELIVSHADDIATETVNLWFYRQDSKYKAFTTLIRINSQNISGRAHVTFRGALNIPEFFESGLYSFYSEPIEAYPANNLRVPKTQNLYPLDFSKFQDGTSSIQVRVSGDLNLPTKTFVGPSYESPIYLLDDKPMTLFTSPPIFKVGEIYDPKRYFELRVPNLEIKVQALSQATCRTIDGKLEFINFGTCDYKVFTSKNSDYLETSINLSSEILPARFKPSINVPQIENFNSDNLPKIVEIGKATIENGQIISPTSTTPSVCMATGQYWIRILSGGTCKLEYKSDATINYLSSDSFIVNFEVTRDPQTITFTPPATANLASRTVALSATASSGGAVTYATTSTGICSITGSTLNLLMRGNCAITATQAGTTTLAPITASATVMIAGAAAPSRKTITCVKGNKSKKVSGTNPKCPTGYKLKR
jgi:hypothetical protein